MRLINSLTATRAIAMGVACAALLCACGGGGAGSSGNVDIVATDKGPLIPTSGPDSFLLFPNPQKQADGTLEVNSAAYATAYYEAIDPNNERTTLTAFRAKNGFGSGTGEEVSIIIGDQRDLGYGRKMTGRRNPNGSLAFVVENYLVGSYGPYSPFNLEAAINGVDQWHLGTNGIEVSVVEPGPANPTPNAIRFVKFYTFNPTTGARLMAANLDGRGEKSMPTICVSCHGGRGDALTPAHPRHWQTPVHTPDEFRLRRARRSGGATASVRATFIRLLNDCRLQPQRTGSQDQGLEQDGLMQLLTAHRNHRTNAQSRRQLPSRSQPRTSTRAKRQPTSNSCMAATDCRLQPVPRLTPTFRFHGESTGSKRCTPTQFHNPAASATDCAAPVTSPISALRISRPLMPIQTGSRPTSWTAAICRWPS